MGKPHKKRKKDTAHRTPPLSRLDKAIYIAIIILFVFVLIGILAGWEYIHRQIAFSDPAVIAYRTGFGYYAILPLLFLIFISGIIALIVFYGGKQPIFGNKTIRYGDYPWKTDLFPLFGPQHRTVRRRASDQKFRAKLIYFLACAFVVTLLLSCFGIFGRTCLREDRTVVTYNSLNRTGEPISIPRNCERIVIQAKVVGKTPSWVYGIELVCEDGHKYAFTDLDFDLRHKEHTDCLRQLLAIKALFSPDQITIERADLLPDVIEHNHLDGTQAALLRKLFEPPN